ncbi:hypothetical protein ACTFIW_000871 [Dictyostelium discoideum]
MPKRSGVFNRFLTLRTLNNAATYIKHWTLELNNPKSPFLTEIKSKWKTFRQSFTSPNQQPSSNKDLNPILIDNSPIQLNSIYNNLLSQHFNSLAKKLLSEYQTILNLKDAYRSTISTNKIAPYAAPTWITIHMEIYSFIAQKLDTISTSFLYHKTYSPGRTIPTTPHSPFTTTPSPIFNSIFTPDHHIHGYYISDRNSTGKFEWSYRDLNFDLNRTEAYRNYISIVFHCIWVWISPHIDNSFPPINL